LTFVIRCPFEETRRKKGEEYFTAKNMKQEFKEGG